VGEFAHVSVALSYMQCVLVDVLECLRLLCFCTHTYMYACMCVHVQECVWVTYVYGYNICV
jgi:hypothetical protein